MRPVSTTPAVWAAFHSHVRAYVQNRVWSWRKGRHQESIPGRKKDNKRNSRITPCQKKLVCPVVVWFPGNSQSISSLILDIVMNAVTTPAQRPVFTMGDVSTFVRALGSNIRGVDETEQ